MVVDVFAGATIPAPVTTVEFYRLAATLRIRFGASRRWEFRAVVVGVSAASAAEEGLTMRRSLLPRLVILIVSLAGGLPDGLIRADGYPDLDDVTRRVAEHLHEDAVVIVTTPATEHDQVEQVEKYLVGTQQRFLIFAESTAPNIPRQIAHAWKTAGGVPRLLLETGFLRPGDGEAFGANRISNSGRNRTFPDLKLDDLDSFTGGGSMPISFLQTILYKIYDYYATNPWPCGNIVTATDVERTIQAISQDAGEVGRSS